MINIRIALLLSWTFAVLATTAQSALVDGQTIGIDFGGTADTDTLSVWNQLTVGGNNVTPGLQDNGVDPNAVTLSTLSTIDGSAVAGVDFTFENSSGEIAFDFSGGAQGNGGLISDTTVFGDGIISNDQPNSGRTVEANVDTFIFTFSGLDDSLTYDLAAGWDSNNPNFNALWSADGQSFTTNTGNNNTAVGYDSLTGLTTDGLGNLEIIQTGVGPTAHITVAALTLTAVAVPEPSSLLALSLCSLGFLRRRKR